MNIVLKNTLLFSVTFISSCNLLSEDACFDRGHAWDPNNNICTDDCIRQGGIFEIANRQCVLSSSESGELKDLFNSVQKACTMFQETLEKDFKLVSTTALEHNDALQYDYHRLAPISYTSKYDFGQDGVCNFTTSNNDYIKILIRKNARIESPYSVNEFDVLKIGKIQTDADDTLIIWERD